MSPQPALTLFVSHAHSDVELARGLVNVIKKSFIVPDKALRCTSIPGHDLEIGAVAMDVLLRELRVTECVIAILTPHSVNNDWVLFELAAAWAHTKLALPLLAGGLREQDLPRPVRGRTGGHLGQSETLRTLRQQLKSRLKWDPVECDEPAEEEIEALVALVKRSSFTRSQAPNVVRLDDTDPNVGPEPVLAGIAPPDEEVCLVTHPCERPNYWVQDPVRSDKAGRWSARVRLGSPGVKAHNGFYEVRAFVDVHSSVLTPGHALDSWPSARMQSATRFVKRVRDR